MNLSQLLKLYDIEKKIEQTTLIALKEAQTHLNYYKNQLIILQKYREDYIKEFESKKQSQTTITISSFNNHYHFDAKIAKGMDSIKMQINSCEATVESARNKWATAHSKVKALEFLVKKKQDMELYDDMIYEQFTLDEFTTRLASYKNKK
jgi:flagellar export protein FliJ